MCKELRDSILVLSHFTAKERKIAMSTKVLTLLPISQRQLLRYTWPKKTGIIFNNAEI